MPLSILRELSEASCEAHPECSLPTGSNLSPVVLRTRSLFCDGGDNITDLLVWVGLVSRRYCFDSRVLHRGFDLSCSSSFLSDLLVFRPGGDGVRCVFLLRVRSSVGLGLCEAGGSRPHFLNRPVLLMKVTKCLIRLASFIILGRWNCCMPILSISSSL